MSLEVIEKIRDAIRRCDRRELDALSALYRIDNVLGAIDGRYEMDFSSTADRIMQETYPGEERP